MPPKGSKSTTCVISIRVDPNLYEKMEKFLDQYQSKNKGMIDLVTTHPDFLKMFPRKEKIKLSMEQLLSASK